MSLSGFVWKQENFYIRQNKTWNMDKYKVVIVDDDEVSLEKVEAQKIQLPKTNIKTKQSLVVNDEQVIQELISRQKEKDVEDIENLWKGTVENNQVIGFALKKLATPESQRRIHSSLMAKT